MTVEDLIHEAEALGVHLWAEGPRLRYEGTPEAVSLLVHALKAHKAELLALLASNDPVGDSRVKCADCQHATPTVHPALIDCGAGRISPAACSSWWATDWRRCDLFVVKGAGNVPDPGAKVLPPPWDAIRDRIHQGWRAKFAPAGPDGTQAIAWHPPGTWQSGR
jgi:hypothetical protein